MVKIQHKLTRCPAELLARFHTLCWRSDVADLLEVEDRILCTLLYGLRERERYHTFEIQKKSKQKRCISAPPRNLAILQAKLHSVLTLVYRPKWCAFGFLKHKSIVDNARTHCKRQHILNIDIEEFFPTIHIGRVIGAFKSYHIGREAAHVLAQICCTAEGVLPQGAPTSPMISNIICRSMDNELMQLAKMLRCRYTRYADDLSFSTDMRYFPSDLFCTGEEPCLGNRLVALIEKHGFRINPTKVRYLRPIMRQDVTGLTVNEFPNIRRDFLRSIQGALYAWEKHGLDDATRLYMEKREFRW